MPLHVEFFAAAADFAIAARSYLASRPLEHNLFSSAVAFNARHNLPGLFWLVRNERGVQGALLQSDPSRRALLTPMDTLSASALAEAATAANALLPGVNGDVASAAAFAGWWTEFNRTGAQPIVAQRHYALKVLTPFTASGRMRQAEEADRPLLRDWFTAFYQEAAGRQTDVSLEVDRLLADGALWLWEDPEPVMMLTVRPSLCHVARLSIGYTPPERRRHGYARACITALSERLILQGLDVTLYADLANETSNALYRSIGFRALSEAIHYRFGPLGPRAF